MARGDPIHQRDGRALTPDAGLELELTLCSSGAELVSPEVGAIVGQSSHWRDGPQVQVTIEGGDELGVHVDVVRAGEAIVLAVVPAPPGRGAGDAQSNDPKCACLMDTADVIHIVRTEVVRLP